jgi:hypothetical protein
MRVNSNRNHYQVLGIDPKASEDEIKKAYKRLARAYHPDLNPKRPRSAHDRFRRLQEAYDVLSDPFSRRQYDQSLGIGQTNPGTNEAAHTKVTKGSWTGDDWAIHPQDDQKKTGWREKLSWRRKLAIGVWAVCLLAAFLPGTIWVSYTRRSFTRVTPLFGLAPSFGVRLLWPTIALIIFWIGNRMSDEDGLETSIGTLGNETVGHVLEVLGWLSFASVMWGTLTGYVSYLSS